MSLVELTFLMILHDFVNMLNFALRKNEYEKRK